MSLALASAAVTISFACHLAASAFCLDSWIILLASSSAVLMIVSAFSCAALSIAWACCSAEELFPPALLSAVFLASAMILSASALAESLGWGGAEGPLIPRSAGGA